LAINRRWSSPSRITLALQQYFMYHPAEPRHTLSEMFSKMPFGAVTDCPYCPARCCQALFGQGGEGYFDCFLAYFAGCFHGKVVGILWKLSFLEDIPSTQP
jgi:hypothetical protein